MRGLGQLLLGVAAALFLISASAGGQHGSTFLACFFCTAAVICLLAGRRR